MIAKKLTLKTEELRVLSASDLGGVAGGAYHTDLRSVARPFARLLDRFVKRAPELPESTNSRYCGSI